MGAPDFSQLASMQEQLREYYSRKILAVFPEMTNHPDIQFGNTYELYIRMVNEGLISEAPNLGDVANSVLAVNVKGEGVTGNGVDDDTVAIQAVIDANPGRRIYFPYGTYNISAALIITASNTVIEFEYGAALNSTNANLTSYFKINGAAWGTSVELATAVDNGAMAITTKTPHGFAPGDIVRLKSQRISTSVDAGEWQLGWSTGTAQGPYFAEWATVYSVTSSTAFTLDAGLTFAGYRPDNTLETHPSAAASATVAKFNPVRNVKIINPTFKGPSAAISTSSGASVVFTRAMDCSIEGVYYPNRPNDGRFIQFADSYRCEARKCFVGYDYITTAEEEHAWSNAFHVVGSQSCGFVACGGYQATQCYDITYSSAFITTSLYCYVKDCFSWSSLYTGMTSHPGTYACTVTGNNFSECRNAGISIRSNKSIIANNMVSGSNDGWGLAISEGGGKDSIFQSNIVSNFTYAMGVRDSTNKWYGGWIGVTFDNNNCENFRWGFYRNTDASSPVVTTPQGIVLSNNKLKSDQVSAKGLKTCANGSYVCGIDFISNHIKLTSTTSIAFEISANSQYVRIAGNAIENARTIMAYDSSVARTIAEKTRVTWKNNDISGAFAATMPDCSADWHYGGDNEIHTLGTTITLGEFRMSGKVRPPALANGSIANGFPIDNFAGWVEIIRMASTSVMQIGTHFSGSAVTMYTRRWTGSAWTAWTLFTA